MRCLLKLRFVSPILPLILFGVVTPAFAAPPAVGAKAPEFSLHSISGKPVSLADARGDKPLVLIVLRGFPGYQCPVCNRQVQDLIKNAPAFEEMGARVLMVYPGPTAIVMEKAQQFVADKPMPAHFDLVLDPDYEVTSKYDLRWNAANETAYPSTFLLDSKGVVFFAKVSNSHGGRTNSAELLELLRKHKSTM